MEFLEEIDRIRNLEIDHAEMQINPPFKETLRARSYGEAQSRESFENALLKEASEMPLEETVEKNIKLKNILWFLSSFSFTRINFSSIRKVLIERKLISEFLFERECQRLRGLRQSFIVDESDYDDQERFDFDSLYSEEPRELIKEEMEKIEKFLEIAGMTDDVVKKAEIYCPHLLDKANALREKIDSEYRKLGNLLKNKRTFHHLRLIATLPFFLTWCKIIMAIKGKVNIDVELVQDRIKFDLSQSKRQEND